MENRTYTIFGYKGKQVRDNIHALDVARFMWAFVQSPRCGEVYNLGGGKTTVVLSSKHLTSLPGILKKKCNTPIPTKIAKAIIYAITATFAK